MSNSLADKIAGMTFPMEAVGKVTLAGREYPVGEIFDAGTIEVVNYLKARKAAKSLSGTTQPVAAAAAPTEAVQASTEAADNAGTAATMDAPSEGKGTPDDRPSQSAGKSGTQSSKRG